MNNDNELTVRLRYFESGDETAIVSLWNRNMQEDRITPNDFANRVLLDPNFQPEGLILSCSGEEIVGFLYAVVRHVTWWNYDLIPDTGWIVSLAVEADLRRRGIGRMMLTQAERFFRKNRRKRIKVSLYSPFYFFTGVDQEQYPAADAFFRQNGFILEKTLPSMEINLEGYVIPSEIRERKSTLAEKGIVSRPLETRDIYETLAFFRKEFPQWTYYLYQRVHGKKWEPYDAIILFDERKREVIGYCQRLEEERAGPFAVASGMRGQGVGTVMLHTLLEELFQGGFKRAWFSSAEKGAVRFYERNGFKMFRLNNIYIKEMEDGK